MTAEELTAELMDSKRFCELFRNAGMQFTKRTLTEEDKRRLVEPIVTLILARMGTVETPIRRAPVPQALHTPNSQGIEVGNLGDDHGLGFDPFVQPADAAIVAAMPPDTPFDPEAKRAEQLEMLRAEIAKKPPHGIGDKLVMKMPPQWNAAEAPLFFQRLGTHVLTPGGNGSFGVQLVGDGAIVTCTRVK